MALKVLLPGFADTPEFSERFLDEGRIVAALSHANIITIHDIGIVPDGHYISMEYVDGGDLRQRIADGVKPETALALLEVMAGCLQYAHQRHIVHRDVKPANILFRKDGSPLLTDFGIAKQLREGTERTVAGTLIGSPHYLSPEQARGEPVDGRSDIYSLGVIFHEMLTGEKPFRGDTDVSIIFQHLQQPIPRLPAKLQRYQPLLDAMLAKQPAERPADAKSMLEFIREMRRSGFAYGGVTGGGRANGAKRPPAESKPPKAPGQPRSMGRRVLLGVTVGSLMAVAAAVALGIKPPFRDTPVTVSSALDKVPQAAQPRQRSASKPVANAPTERPTEKLADKKPVDAKKPATRPAKKPVAVAKAAPSRPKRATSPAPVRKQPITTSKRSSRAPKRSVPRFGNTARINRLLDLGDRALRDYRLTTPPGKNAYEYYRTVLSLEPGNKKAKRGITRVANRYAWLAQGRLEKYEYKKARRYVDLGLKVEPDNRRLLALKRDARLRNAPKHFWKDIQKGAKGFGNDVQDLFRGF